MPAKPYAPSHIGSVASTYTSMRIAGAVKDSLVDLVCEELDHLVPLMEAATLDNDSERKTLDDAQRTRLNYNRTRELMIDRIKHVESVGSAAVQGGIEHLEKFLGRLMRHCEEAASRDRVSTIKPRHLEIALHSMGKGPLPLKMRKKNIRRKKVLKFREEASSPLPMSNQCLEPMRRWLLPMMLQRIYS